MTDAQLIAIIRKDPNTPAWIRDLIERSKR